MLDLRFIRENTDLVKKGLKNKGDKSDLGKILNLDSERRDLLQKVEQLKHERNVSSQEVSKLKKEKKDAAALIERTRTIGQEIKLLDESLNSLQAELDAELDRIPNIPHESVPVGKDASQNVVIKAWGKIPEFDFEISDHIEIGERLDIFDFPRGSKITGRGFPVYTGMGAKLERALINFMLDLHTTEHGYREMLTPFLANRSSMRGTGQLPKLEEDMYLCETDDLFLIPTAEVSVTNFHRDEILNAEQLPLKYCAYSACFRREAGSWGKETRGFLRLHQFNKVEMVKYTLPEESYSELELLLQNACRVLEILGLPYRVVELCSGDLSFAAAKCYDIEVWAPSEQRWLEVSSCSNFEDFQARRMNIRFRRSSTTRPEYLHTLNGSGVATPRLLVALLEVYQNEDGSVTIPEPLRKFTGFNAIKRELI